MTCHNCLIEATKNGKHRNGLQRFRCAQCGKTYTELHEDAFRVEDHLRTDRGQLAIRLLVEGNSIRSVERITGYHRNIIMQLLLIAGQRCEALLATKIRSVPVSDVQCDEIWGFVGKKERSKGDGDGREVGDAWCFIAIERTTKLVLSFQLGKRTVKSALQFMGKLSLASDAGQRFQLTTDRLNAYPYAVAEMLGDRVDYAQLIKVYAYSEPESARRYSPPDVVEAIPTPVYGDPDRQRICTSHIERQNGSLRQWCKRLTRLTYAFSKKWENLQAALALHFAFYNFCRVHGTIKATPAMAAGVADRVWTIHELVGA